MYSSLCSCHLSSYSYLFMYYIALRPLKPFTGDHNKVHPGGGDEHTQGEERGRALPGHEVRQPDAAEDHPHPDWPGSWDLPPHPPIHHHWATGDRPRPRWPPQGRHALQMRETVCPRCDWFSLSVSMCENSGLIDVTFSWWEILCPEDGCCFSSSVTTYEHCGQCWCYPPDKGNYVP